MLAAKIENENPFTLIAGVNVLEDMSVSLRVADELVSVCRRLGIPFIFKASFDKANRSDHRSYRGPGLSLGLEQLREIKRAFSVAVVTDVHEPHQVAAVAEVVDVIQIPAFLSRQTDLLLAAAKTGLPILLKKMQMMSPQCALQAREKLLALGAADTIICERGSSFGYQNLVLDLQGVCEMARQGAPVVVDVSHAMQQPGAKGRSTGGRGMDVPALARAAIAVGVGGIFLECHPNPSQARCDGPCALPLDSAAQLIEALHGIDQLVKVSSGSAP